MDNVITLRKKAPEPRVLEENHFDAYLTGHLTGENKPLDGSLTAAFYLVRDILNQPDTIKATAQTHSDKEAIDILTGALCIAKRIMPGQVAPITSVINNAALHYPQFSYRMLTDKSKLALITAGILIKINPVKYRWADLDELNHCLNPIAGGAENLQRDCNAATTTCNGTATEQQHPATGLQRAQHALQRMSAIRKACKPQALIDDYHRWRTRHDAWAEVLPDGSIQRHRKAFTGELTAQEKKAIRETHERNCYAKLLTNAPALTPEAKQLAEQKQLEMIERKAAMAAQMDTLKMWGKILGVLGVVLFILNTLGNQPPPITPVNPETAFLPGGIHRGTE